MSIPFVDRPPTLREVEKLRLILSTYQDGSGMLMQHNRMTLPGWRDFERSVAVAFSGLAQESKFIFDILFADPNKDNMFYGLSCKMRRELNKVNRTGRATMELSNSAGKFWDHLRQSGIDQLNYTQQPAVVGKALIELVKQWHYQVSVENGGFIDLTKCSYLALLWNKSGLYQLFQFPLTFVDPGKLNWSYPVAERRIIAHDSSGILFEWYGESGGQLKYYPTLEMALWMSKPFRLEPLTSKVDQSLLVKAARYFPDLWKKVS